LQFLVDASNSTTYSFQASAMCYLFGGLELNILPFHAPDMLGAQAIPKLFKIEQNSSSERLQKAFEGLPPDLQMKFRENHAGREGFFPKSNPTQLLKKGYASGLYLAQVRGIHGYGNIELFDAAKSVMSEFEKSQKRFAELSATLRVFELAKFVRKFFHLSIPGHAFIDEIVSEGLRLPCRKSVDYSTRRVADVDVDKPILRCLEAIQRFRDMFRNGWNKKSFSFVAPCPVIPNFFFFCLI